MRPGLTALSMLCLAGCVDAVEDFHHLDGSAVDAKQLVTARKVCLEARLDATATISPPIGGTPKDGDYAKALRARITRHAVERDDETICMVSQDVFAGKGSKGSPR